MCLVDDALDDAPPATLPVVPNTTGAVVLVYDCSDVAAGDMPHHLMRTRLFELAGFVVELVTLNQFVRRHVLTEVVDEVSHTEADADHVVVGQLATASFPVVVFGSVECLDDVPKHITQQLLLAILEGDILKSEQRAQVNDRAVSS